MYRDNLGRFATKPTPPPIPSFSIVRDEKGRFASKQPVYKTDSLGNLRDKLGRFAPKPVVKSTFKKPSNKKLTIDEILSAIEANGYKQAFGHYINRHKITGAVTSACAIGQGALNLGVGYREVTKALGSNLSHDIISLNDNHKLPLKEIVKRVREKYTNVLGQQTSLIAK